MAWPDTTALSRTNLDADADTVTGVDGGRDQIDKAVQRLNSLLNASTQGSVLYTTNNPQPYQPISGVSQNEIVVGSATGTPAGSNKTFETTLTDSDTKVSTSKAVKTYVDNEVTGAVPFQCYGVINIDAETWSGGYNIKNINKLLSSPAGVRVTFADATNFANTSYKVLVTMENIGGTSSTGTIPTVTAKTTSYVDISCDRQIQMNLAIIGTLA